MMSSLRSEHFRETIIYRLLQGFMTTLWFIGQNESNECGVLAEKEDDWKEKSTLTLCEWSERNKWSKSVTVNKGFQCNIYTIKTEFDELLCFGFIRTQSELSSEKVAFHTIPLEVYTLCTQYFGDVFNEYWSAGYNRFGGCGQGIENELICSPCSLGQIEGMDNIKHISNGCIGTATLWIKHDGSLYVHGMNRYGMLGFEGETRSPYTPVLSEFSQKHSDLRCVYSACSALRSFIICNDNSVWSAGGARAEPNGFQKVSFLNCKEHLVSVATGYGKALFLSANGNVYEFDYLEPDSAEMIPFFHENKVKIESICCGQFHYLALSEEKKMYSWGQNEQGYV